jgi:hypothetical protein
MDVDVGFYRPMARVARPDKLSKLVAVFDRFYGTIARLDDPIAKQLVENWTRFRHHYVAPSGAPRSAFAAGMEQALREMPLLLQSMSPQVRKCAVQALSTAISAHYPDFLFRDGERLEKIKARGSIRGENEFHLVRHHVDLLEGEPIKADELRLLYGPLEGFEAHDR